jgi:predicted dehydrogenase
MKNATQSKNEMNRREFIKGAAASGVTMGFASAASRARANGANERVGIGVIGVGNRGDQLMNVMANCPTAQVTAVCDVYQPYLDRAKGRAGAAANAYTDYRKMLEDPAVEAVVIATPDHWHAKQTIDACLAGKDVYIEKPLSLTVSEGRKMADMAAATRRVVQMGAQRHSAPYIREACQAIREGAIGKVTYVRCFHLVNEWPNGIGRRKVSALPAGLDWDMWLGPAPKVPFEELVWNYKFRWFWAYSGGQMTNFGTHWLDVIQMAIPDDAPKNVVALGGKFAVDDDREVPDTMEAIWEFPSGCLVTFSQINANEAPGSLPGVEIEFRGTMGTLYIYGNRYEIVPEEVQASDYPARGPHNRDETIKREKRIEAKTVKGSLRVEDHMNNFLECVKTRKPCNCDIETGHRSTTTTLVANLAYRVGQRLEWDREKERFTNSREANKLLSYKHRKPWTI